MAEKPKLLVLDASVVAKWFIHEPDSPIASQLLTDAVSGRWLFAIPELLRLELSHIFWKHKSLGYTQRQLHLAFQELERLGVQEVPTLSLLPKAIELAYKAEIAVYDACYVALGQSLRSPLATFDLQLIKRIRRHSLAAIHEF